ncbi:unnamed protein product [Prunus armeniaca]
MGETQREMAEMIKELKNSAPKPSEENEKHLQEESAAAGKEYKQKWTIFCHSRGHCCHAGKGAESKSGRLEVSSSATVPNTLAPAAIS